MNPELPGLAKLYAEITGISQILGDAWDEPDTGEPPCLFCRREMPCECADGPCMCSCGRCCAPGLPLGPRD